MQRATDCSFIHSFVQAISIAHLQYTTTQRHSRYSTDTVSEFHTEALQAAASEGLAQGPYVAARVRFKPTKGVESTSEPPRPTNSFVLCVYVYAQSIYLSAHAIIKKRLG